VVLPVCSSAGLAAKDGSQPETLRAPPGSVVVGQTVDPSEYLTLLRLSVSSGRQVRRAMS
jgi:hypothetical protein